MSYAIMSYPNLLEHHLLSSCPVVDSSPSVSLLPKGLRMPYATCLATKLATAIYCLIHSPLSFGYCAVFNEVFATLLSNYFSLKSVGLFRPKFPRCATVFQPVDNSIVQQLRYLEYKVFVSKVYLQVALERRERGTPRICLNPINSVSFAEEAKITFFDLDTIEAQFSQLFDRPVDIVTKQAIEQSHNWIRKNNILNNAKVIYRQRSRDASRSY